MKLALSLLNFIDSHSISQQIGVKLNDREVIYNVDQYESPINDTTLGNHPQGFGTHLTIFVSVATLISSSFNFVKYASRNESHTGERKAGHSTTMHRDVINATHMWI